MVIELSSIVVDFKPSEFAGVISVGRGLLVRRCFSCQQAARRSEPLRRTTARGVCASEEGGGSSLRSAEIPRIRRKCNGGISSMLLPGVHGCGGRVLPGRRRNPRFLWRAPPSRLARKSDCARLLPDEGGGIFLTYGPTRSAEQRARRRPAFLEISVADLLERERITQCC